MSAYDGIIEVGFDGQPVPPILVLSSRGGHRIGVIQNVASINQTHPLSDVAELSFDVYKEINGQVCENWDKIKDFKLIQIPRENLWFEAHVTLDEENDIIKHVTCVHANEAELAQINLYETEINTEDDIGRDDYEETFFYDKDKPNASLLNRILKDKAPHYQIYHVDDTLCKVFRQFNFNGVSIQDALNQIAQEVGCLFKYGEWDENDGKYHRTISAYDLEDYCYTCHKRGVYSEHICTNCGSNDIKYGYGEDTGIFISKENLATSISYESNKDDVKNCFRLSAGDDTMTAAIKACNPNMSQYIWYFSDDMLDDMSDELSSKIQQYNTTVDNYMNNNTIDVPSNLVTSYNSLVNTYKTYNDELETINYPIVGTTKLVDAYYKSLKLYGFLRTELAPASEKVKTTTSTEQMDILSSNGNMRRVGISSVSGQISYTSANTAIQSYAKVFVDTSRYKVTVNTNNINGVVWSGSITIKSYINEEDTATGVFTITLFDGSNNARYTEWIEQNIKKAMANREATDISVVKLFSNDESLASFKNKLHLYSLSNLSTMEAMATSAITIMVEQGIPKDRTKYSDVYNQLYKPYLNKRNAIVAEMSLRETQLSYLLQPVDEYGNTSPLYPSLGLINYIELRQNEISKILNIENFIGDELLEELLFYRRENEYKNANYISDGLSDSEIIQYAQRFYEEANREIKKSATLQHTISAPLINFLLMGEFKKLQKSFDVGNWIRLKVDDAVYKLRLTNWTIDYDDIESLDVEFSDAIRVGNSVSDIQSILSKSRSMSTTYDYTVKQANKGKDASDAVKLYRDNGIDFRKVKAIASKGNTNIVYDDDGILLKRVIESDELPEQARIYNNGIYITKDAWETVSTGLGHFSYVDPETGNVVETYGIIADTVIGKLILGENLKIYSESGRLEMGDNGLKVTSIDGQDNSDLFVVQKEMTDEYGRKYVEKYIYVDADGNVKIAGNSVVIGGKPIIEYINEAVESVEVSLPITIQIDSSAGVIFKNRSISTILTATVYRGGKDITSEISEFRWTKKDKDGNIDTSWSRYTTSNVISISSYDVDSKAVFGCEVTVEQ